MAWRRYLLRALAGLTVLVAAPWALAQTVTALDLTPSSGLAGSITYATGSGYAPGTGVIFRWTTGAAIGSGVADPTGSFSNIPLTIPGDAPATTHTVSACQPDPATGGEVCPGSAPFQVIPPPTTTSTLRPTTTSSTTTTTATTSTTTTTTTTTTPAVFGVVIPDWPDDFDLSLPPPGPDPGPGPSVAVPKTVPPPPDDLEIPLPEVFPDLYAIRMEVTQGIQNLANQMPLVSKRRTYVRVYVGVDGADTWPAYGALEVKRSGQLLGYRWPEGAGIVARADGGDRSKLQDTLYFSIPDDWADGQVTFRTFVYSYDKDTPFEKEPWSFNNYQTTSVEFHPAQPAMLHLVPLHLHRSYHPADVPRVYEPDLGGIQDQIAIQPQPSNTVYSLNGMFRYHPISELGYEMEWSDLYRQPLQPAHALGQEWNLGPCPTVLDHFQPIGNYYLPDFKLLYEEDPGDLGEGNNLVLFEPDYRTLYVLDRVVSDIKHYIEPDEDGGFRAVGDDNGVGPAPSPQTPVFIGGCKSTGYSGPNNHMSLFRMFEDWDSEREFFLGMVHPSLPTFFGGLATGSADAAWVTMANTFSSNGWEHRAARTVAHEIGHLAGLKHVPCSDSDDDGEPDELIGGSIDESHPAGAVFPDCSLSDVEPDGYYGFDVYWKLWGLDGPEVISNDPDADQTAFPLMGYRSPKWPDPYHYCILLDYYGVPCDPAAIGVPGIEGDNGDDGEGGGGGDAPEESPVDPGEPVAFISGLFDSESGAITIDRRYGIGPATEHVARRVAEQAIDILPFPFSVVVVGPAGEEVYVDRQGRSDSGHDAETLLDWGSVVPVEGAARVEIRADDGSVLGGFDVSASPPTVEVVRMPMVAAELDDRAFEFVATDADGDPLEAALLYSPDGEHWEVVVPYRPTDRLEVTDLRGLPGSDEGRFMIRVTDGFLTSEALVDVAYEIANSSPTVEILLPLAGSVVAHGSEVTLAGSVHDLEDRFLAADSLRWASSLDGELGSGSSLWITGLSPGEHVITLTAVDSGGASGTSMVTLRVDPSVVQVLPGEAWIQAMEIAFGREGEDAPGSTTTMPGVDVAASADEESDSAIPELAAIVVLCALAGVGYLALRGRVKPRFPWMRDD